MVIAGTEIKTEDVWKYISDFVFEMHQESERAAANAEGPTVKATTFQIYSGVVNLDGE